MFKNWKSTSAFFIFIGIYIWAIYSDKNADIIDVVAYVALYSSLFMMFRNDMTKELLSKIVDKIDMGKK